MAAFVIVGAGGNEAHAPALDLTAVVRCLRVRAMQVTIEIPDRLAKQVEPEREHLAEILELGLRQHRAQASGLRREFLAFLARGPQPSEIIAFRPSEAAVERARELLRRNKQGHLTPEEEAEMDDIGELDHVITQVKAQARLHLRAA
ncbi:MAG: hypothetical protein AAB466_06735 [Verrucomicrobiota bacterium]